LRRLGHSCGIDGWGDALPRVTNSVRIAARIAGCGNLRHC
jgi:hypothetical protein